MKANEAFTGEVDVGAAGTYEPLSPEEDARLRAAQEALLARPRLSIRTRLVAGLALCFLLCGAFALGSYDVLGQLQARLHLLQTLERLQDRTLRVRALADEGILSRDDLERVVERTSDCEILIRREPSIARIAAPDALAPLLRLAETCRELLRAPRREEGDFSSLVVLPAAQAAALRTRSVEASADLERIIRRERTASDRALRLTAVAPLVMLAALFALFAVITLAMTRALGVPIARFRAHTARIAQGDFSFITPARRYQDEFSDLTLAVNKMLSDLRAQQDRVVKGAKLALVGTLTSGIAHEINNPINNISITTEALQEGGAAMDEEERARHLQDISFETERMTELVRNLLDFTRKEKIDAVAIDVPALLRSTIRLVQSEMKVHGVTLVADLPPDVPRVRGATNQLRQVFLNLMLNAIQAMPAGGPLVVRARSLSPGRVRVDVGDSGVGIPPELLPRIFDPFFTTKEPGKGTGLGLSISLAIVKKLGGDIQVRSEPGHGTTFHVDLPRGDEEPHVASAQAT